MNELRDLPKLHPQTIMDTNANLPFKFALNKNIRAN